MQKILVILACCLLFFSCASNNSEGSVQADIIDGATAVDSDISGLQGQQAESTGNAQAITDTSEQIADSIDTAISQLSEGEGTDSEFARIIQQVQSRQSIDYVETNGTDITASD